MAKKVVPGSITKAYEKREGDFSPDLVGFQYTNGSSLFTLGNFSVTTNAEPISGTFFHSGSLSDAITLDSLNLTQSQSNSLNTDKVLSVKLKNDKSNIFNYVYFSDVIKFFEVEIKDIILKWRGSLYLQKSNTVNNVIDFNYNIYNNKSTFRIPTNLINNVFDLVTTNETYSFGSSDEDISVLKYNYTKYEIYNDFGSFGITNYIGDSSNNQYITIETIGNVWPTLSATSASFKYHVKPKDNVLDTLVFNKLTDFQTQLLNRLTIPKYTAGLNLRYTDENGFTFNTEKKFTWPTTDGYNLDISGRDYSEYLEKLFSLARQFDTETTNIMTRRLISSAILEFDTDGDGTAENGRKMDKLLKLWGREFDEVKKYIDGISFANVVTYNGKDNTPDELIKILAKNLGFDTIQSFSDNDLINYLVTTTNTVFSGHSRSLSIQEMDTELWRRLVINVWWLFKSKGTRKVIEFFLNLFKIEECLIDLDEYVYLVESKLQTFDVYKKIRSYAENIIIDDTNELQVFVETTIDSSPIDQDGYPKILPDTPEYYFQMDGFWYNGGTPDNTNPNLNGNNPHFGPYDFGRSYFDKFRCFLDGFTPVTETVNLNELTFNYFEDYTYGTVENTPTQTVNVTNNSITTTDTGHFITNYGTFYAGVINTDRITSGSTVTGAGKSNDYSNTGVSSIRINLSTGVGDECEFCPPEINLSNGGKFGGAVTYIDANVLYVLTNEPCCDFYGYYSYYNNETGGKKCYWCPPSEYFVETSILTTDGISNTSSEKKPLVVNAPSNTEILFQTPDGELIKPTRSCCTLRGYQWNNITKRCVKKQTTIDYISNTENAVL